MSFIEWCEKGFTSFLLINPSRLQRFSSHLLMNCKRNEYIFYTYLKSLLYLFEDLDSGPKAVNESVLFASGLGKWK